MSKLYEGPIIDAHHHLWVLTLGRHPWLTPKADERGGLGDLGPLRRNYLPADYARDATRHAIVATVHIEAGWLASDPLGETRWLDTLDKTGGIAARYVAHVPLASAAAPATIDRQAANPRVVGLRDILSWHEDSARRFAARGDLMSDPVWRANLKRLAGLGLTFDLMVFAHQSQEAARLVANSPDQIFVLNHCGSPSTARRKACRDGATGLRRLPLTPMCGSRSRTS